MLLGLGGHAVSASDLADFNAVDVQRILDLEFSDRKHYLRPQFGAIGGLRGIFDERDNLVGRDRRFRRVDDGFDFGFKAHLIFLECHSDQAN